MLLIDLSEVIGLLFLHQNRCCKAFAGISLMQYVAAQGSVKEGFVVT